MKKFNKLLINFRNLKTRKTETQLKKERFMKNVNELYKNYYNAHKTDYDTNNELKKRKRMTANSFYLTMK